MATIGALLTEFSGVAGVGELYGVPRAYTLTLAAVALLAVVLTGSYRRVERAAIAIGLFELAFFYVAWAAHPSVADMARGAVSIPWRNPDYLYLSAANIGAVIMPWMIFYQQSAVADKKLRPEHYTAARWDTAAGALLTQLVMAAVLIACAATIGAKNPQASLTTVGEMSQALTPFMGQAAGKLVFCHGRARRRPGRRHRRLAGARLGRGRGRRLPPLAGIQAAAGRLVLRRLRPVRGRPAPRWWPCGPNLVSLNVGVQVMNALLLPLVLGFLIALAIFSLPPARRLRGWYMWLVIVVAALTTALGVFGGLSGAGLV